MADRLVFISGKMVKGGSERVLSVLANHFSKSKNVKIITLLSDTIGYELDASIEVENLSGRDRLRLIKSIGWIVKLIREFRKLDRDDVVISFVARVNIVTLLANIFAGVPVIVSERNDPARDGRGVFTKMLVRLLYPRADNIVFQSEYAMSLFEVQIRDKGVVIPNPVGPFDIEWTKAIENTFINVGRLSEQKNQALLIDAFSDVLKAYPDSGLYIFGEGPIEDKLKMQCMSLGVDKRVFFMGVCEDIHQRMVKFGAFVLSSDYEGQSNALMEAMALGMPCITTDISGHRGIVDANTALVVEAGDRQQLAKAMIEFIEKPELRRSLGRNAAIRLKDLDKSRILERWWKLLEGLKDG